MRVIYVLPLLLLTACGYESPTWMPMGYAYHNEVYKAQPGPEADSLGYDYTAARNDYINAMWIDVARGLIDDLEAKTGMAPQAVYVEKLPGDNAFNLSLDNALRDELRNRGYTLVNGAPGATHIKYQAFRAGDENARNEIPFNEPDYKERKPWNPENEQEFVFVLTLLEDGAAFAEVRRHEMLPGYGYVSGEGNIVPQPRVMESAVQE